MGCGIELHRLRRNGFRRVNKKGKRMAAALSETEGEGSRLERVIAESAETRPEITQHPGGALP